MVSNIAFQLKRLPHFITIAHYIATIRASVRHKSSA